MDHNMDIIYCNNHGQQVSARCLDCRLFLCLDCIIEHQNTTHTVKRLENSRHDLINRLNSQIETLTQKLSELKMHEQSPHYKRLEMGLEMIEQCKFEILQLVEKHFQDYREQFTKIMHVMKGTKATEDIIYQKMDEYRQTIQELQANVYKTAELNEHDLIDDLQNVLDRVQKKQQSAAMPKIKLNENALFRMADCLTHLLSVQSSRDFMKKSLNFRNDRPVLASFLELSSTMFLFWPRQQTALKVVFRDFTAPLKSKAVVLNGKVFLIGGQKTTSDGSIRYYRQINMLDHKYCMMKVMALMRQGRILHSVVAVIQDTRQSILILGGKNIDRLNTFQKYDVNQSTISLLKPFNLPLAGQSGTQINDKVYYFGGFIEDEPCRNILIYDLKQDIWQVTQPLNPNAYISTVDPIILPINKQNIIILGGLRKEGSTQPYCTEYVQHYNTKHQWFLGSYVQRLPSGVHSISHGFDFHEGNFYAIAGIKRHNQQYGPGCPEVLKIDLTKEVYRLYSMIDYM